MMSCEGPRFVGASARQVDWQAGSFSRVKIK